MKVDLVLKLFILENLTHGLIIHEIAPLVHEGATVMT